MLDAIPAELKACPQWIAWQYQFNTERNKWDKIPLNVRNGRKCDVSQNTSWTTFEDVCGYVAQYEKQGVGAGFVLGYGSGIVGIDFDDVFDTAGDLLRLDNHSTAGQLNSYTEYSPSGTGLHVLVKAQFPHGRRHDGVEIYGIGRFFTVTGRVYGGRYTLEDRQSYVDAMAGQIDANRALRTHPLDWTLEPSFDDATVHHRAMSAANGAKYSAYWAGNWQQFHSSQSEADVSLVNILAYYSDSPSQVVRMFKQSALGQRTKADRASYLSGMLQKAWDQKAPVVPIPALPAVVEQAVAPEPILDAKEVEVAQAKQLDPFRATPPGWVGYIAAWLNAQSNYPMPEINVIGALGVMAAICGRQYQYSGSGLNLYMMLLAKTGAGKESLNDGISRLFSAVTTPPANFGPVTTASVNTGFPAAGEFVGRFDLTSGVGIKRAFAESSTLSCVALATEFAQVMSQLADPKAHQGLKDAKQVMLDFYTKSGAGVTYQGKMNSDKAKDIKPLMSPTLSIVAQGTPERFYEALNNRMITDGLISRFIIVERRGYTAHNPYHADNAEVPEALRHYITQLCQQIFTLRVSHDQRITVTHTPEAEKYSEHLRLYYRSRLEANVDNEVNAALWNRAHQNIIRMAALVAIGCDQFRPAITVEHLEWANAIIYKQCLLMIEKFRRGEVGEASTFEAEQSEHVLAALFRWKELDIQAMTHMPRTYQQAKIAGLMPYAFLQERCGQLAAFKNDKKGPRLALKLMLDSFVRTGEVEPAQFGTSRAVYYKLHL